MKPSKSSSHKYDHGGRILGWRVWVIVGTIFTIWVLSHYGNIDNTYIAEHATSTVAVHVTATAASTTEQKIQYYFPRNGRTMIAVAKAESQLKMSAVGYNCMYSGKSKACKPEDRSRAWSRDCGIMQINTTAKTCPKETVDQHLKRAADLSRVQGLEAWVTYQTGAHEKYLATN